MLRRIKQTRILIRRREVLASAGSSDMHTTATCPLCHSTLIKDPVNALEAKQINALLQAHNENVKADDTK